MGAPLYDALSGEWPVYRSGRRAGVAALRLRPGEVVLDVGCGTGLTFPLLYKAIGPNGRVVGLDASAEMLRQARRRAERNAWANVELVQADAQAVDPGRLAEALGPGGAADALVFVYALSLMPDWQAAWRHAVAVARPGARVSVVDLRLPVGRAAWLSPLARLACALGGSDPGTHPWTAVENETDDVERESLWGGHVQVRAGRARGGAR